MSIEAAGLLLETLGSARRPPPPLPLLLH
jgi:tRNA-Thr(GGU) m(6)t(6)A37 methyltransferase TsaA